MFKNFIRILGGDPNKRAVDKLSRIVDQINTLESSFEQLSDQALAAKTTQFRSLLAQRLSGINEAKARQKAEQEALDEILPEAFAAVREASKRTLGLRHYDVQLLGGIILHQGKIAEMRTGEGKTLVATLPLYLNAITGRGVHLITVNDYLARRDARWKAPIYNLLGLSVGVLQMAARTENGKKAFLVDLSKESPQEDQHQLVLVPRKEAYAADILYGTNSEFGFDYLRDNMAASLEDRVQRGHYYAIVDEVDNVLIDEARTPLIISGPASENVDEYYRMAQVVRQLRAEDYEISERDHTVTLTEIGEMHVEEILGFALRDPDRPEDMTIEQERLIGYLEQALRAQYLFRRNKDYLVQGGKVIIVDEFTGRQMPGRRWSDGLHQAVEAKENVKVEPESVTYATITIQNYFRMYQKLAGMSGTAVTESEEFNKIYKLDVLPVPTNLEYQVMRTAAPLVELEAKDEEGYKYRYYAGREDASKKPVFFRRKDYPDVIYRTEEAKFRAICLEILRYHTLGRPILVGTTSVELSERLSTRLRAEPLRRLAQVQLLRQAWFQKHQLEQDGRTVPELKFMNEPLEKLDVAELRKLAREVEISFNPEEAGNLQQLLSLLQLSAAQAERLTGILQGGVSHEVLNARKHTEESLIIAGAGAFGAVTIATNMAGRGVDIKLGGELAEEHLVILNRVLRRSGHADPYGMTMEQRRQALQALLPEAWGIYESEVRLFFQHMDDMEAVKALGGLHVIGSERHEARRIDNQLRGRSARQGDPGSSRFYLSMEDDLMRRFGGQQADNLMQRFQIDDALPLEFGVVSRIIESSQTRVEGANFDVRKHLLEYDDVLNQQRAAVYGQRDRIFVKDDLSDDVAEMLRIELKRRVPEALKDTEGPWKLVAWLDQVQPPLSMSGTIQAPFSVELLAETIKQPDAAAFLEIIKKSLQAEEEHLMNALRSELEHAEERLDSQRKDRLEALDLFIEGIKDEEEEGEEPGVARTPRQLAEDLSNTLRLPLRYTPESIRLLAEDPRQFAKQIRPQIEAAVLEQTIRRLIGSLERRLSDTLELDIPALSNKTWAETADQITATVETVLERRRERLVGAQGVMEDEIRAALAKGNGALDENTLVAFLLGMRDGVRSSFDKKTHRRIRQRMQRFTYIYYVARLLEDRDPEDVTEMVLDHLDQVQESQRRDWGESESERLGTLRLCDLEEKTQDRLRLGLGEAYDDLKNERLNTLTGKARENVIAALGRNIMTQIYRQLLVGVISDLWVDYLTQMEALRVSIGLESYAQRDPLVQYKNRAYDLYQTLLTNTRLGVINRMFTYRPRNLQTVQAAVEKEADEAPETETGAQAAMQAAPQTAARNVPSAAAPAAKESSSKDEPGDSAPGGKRKRRRH